MAMLEVGAPMRAVVEARRTILDILKSAAEEETKRQALQTLGQLCAVTHTSIQNCSFIAKGGR
jgi:hypothetical protein